MATHKCPKNGCEVQCPPSKLACASHWADVPRSIQNKVYRTFRKWLDDPQPYFAARQEAIDAMNGVT